MIDGDVVFAAFHAIEQIAGVGDDKVGPHIQFLGEHLTQFDFESREFVALLEIERGCISLNGDA
ncbi:hypothetical protein D3C78_1932010 [compost metagenome]